MRKRISLRLTLLVVTAFVSGCAAPACLSLIPITGSAYEGYVVWKSGEATKYYAFDPDTTYRAVMRTCDQLKLKAMVMKSAPKERYSLEIKGNIPMHIDVLPRDMGITAVVISIPTFGDKNYVELFYKLIDDNLPKKATAGEKIAP